MAKLSALATLVAFCGIVATVAHAYGPRDASASRADCPNVTTSKITGREVVTSPGFGCQGARNVMREYFNQVVNSGQTVGGCAQVRINKGCRVGKFRCFTIYKAAASELRGVCKGAKGRVRFLEIDRGPN